MTSDITCVIYTRPAQVLKLVDDHDDQGVANDGQDKDQDVEDEDRDARLHVTSVPPAQEVDHHVLVLVGREGETAVQSVDDHTSIGQQLAQQLAAHHLCAHSLAGQIPGSER